MELTYGIRDTDSREALVRKIQQSERKLLREKERDLTAHAVIAKSRNHRSLHYNLVLRTTGSVGRGYECAL